MPSRDTKPADAPTTGRRHPADSANDRALKDDDDARRDDPHGHAVADIADQDEPRGAPTSERHDTETAAGRIGGRDRRRG